MEKGNIRAIITFFIALFFVNYFFKISIVKNFFVSLFDSLLGNLVEPQFFMLFFMLMILQALIFVILVKYFSNRELYFSSVENSKLVREKLKDSKISFEERGLLKKRSFENSIQFLRSILIPIIIGWVVSSTINVWFNDILISEMGFLGMIYYLMGSLVTILIFWKVFGLSKQ